MHTYIHTYIREREIGEREAWGDGEDGEQWAVGGREDDRTHKGDKGEGKKEKRERTMSAD